MDGDAAGGEDRTRAKSEALMDALSIAFRLGLKRYQRSWRGRCPCCDYAAGTFAVREGKAGRAWLYCANGCGRSELEEAVAAATGHRATAMTQGDHDVAAVRERNQERALALWQGSGSISGTPADTYLAARGLSGLSASPALRFREDTPHPEGGRLPALIALVSDVSSAPISVHRTFITRDGRKADVEPAKASLGPVWGGAIRLASTAEGGTVVIGEGIESSASAGRLMGLPAWAAISAGNLAKGVLLPPKAVRMVIAADPDEAGREAARQAWLRWIDEGRSVQIAIPDGAGDFNDLLRAREADHA